MNGLFPSCTLLLRLRGWKGRFRISFERKWKIAEKFLTKQSKSLKKKNGKDVDNYLEKYKEETAKSMEEIDEAVIASIDLCKGKA
ncbi:hypothetical protein AMTRI_Chr02g213620 [Amborella trichopoda]